MTNIDDNIARHMITATLINAANYLATHAPRIADPALSPWYCISDDDDYMPAAAGVIRALIEASYNSEHDSPRAALDALLDDSEFNLDASTCDFDAPIFALLADL